MLNPHGYENSRPDGHPVFELVDESMGQFLPRFVPLRRTELQGSVAGPLTTLRLRQTFSHPGPAGGAPFEALYRFPLPGDAAVTGVRIRFGDVEIRTELKERNAAEILYAQARAEGRQSALVTRESPDIFTLAVTGLRPGEEVVVETEYVHLARPERDGWSLRVPLTTAPRFVRPDEAGSRHADGQPLALVRDPGHRFALDLTVPGPVEIRSTSHAIVQERAEAGLHVRLDGGDVLPDRDFVLTWRSSTDEDRPAVSTWVHADDNAVQVYFLTQCTPPTRSAATTKSAREIILLVDHSGSMEGPKWQAADWAVERFLAGLTGTDHFALGVFHDKTRWFTPHPVPAEPPAVAGAVKFLRDAKDSGGTNLGVALEQALDLIWAEGLRSRHVLILTDAEVTDAGRLLKLVDAESDRPDRRRVSVLCIDAAPNETLATSLAERGGGVSRFLTSSPAEDDITTALDELLADWDAPVRTGLTLDVNRPRAEALGRLVRHVRPGPLAAIDVGDVPAGRPVWVVGRAPLDGDPLTFRLTDGAGIEIPSAGVPLAGGPGLKSLFGAERIRRLEYLSHSDPDEKELRAELDRLGYEPTTRKEGRAKTYPENAAASAHAMCQELLVREALSFGLPSAETAFVAVRSESGQRVGATVIVPNAIPVGGDAQILAATACASVPRLRMMARATPIRKIQINPMSVFFGGGPSAMATQAESPTSSHRLQFPVPGKATADDAETVVFDSARDAATHHLPASGRLTSITATATGIDLTTVHPQCELRLLIGDASSPRAKVRLCDLLVIASRPLNLRWKAGETVRLVLTVPNGIGAIGYPPLEIAFEWDG